jgi:hypothetical protein
MTESIKYDSKYSPGKKVSGLKLIIEIVCENKAKKDNKELPTQFWKIKEWENYYKSQLRAASKLCKEFGENRVLSFVRKNTIYSLYPKWVKEGIAKIPEEKIEESKLKIADKVKVKTKRINKLEGLD